MANAVLFQTGQEKLDSLSWSGTLEHLLRLSHPTEDESFFNTLEIGFYPVMADLL